MVAAHLDADDLTGADGEDSAKEEDIYEEESKELNWWFELGGVSNYVNPVYLLFIHKFKATINSSFFYFYANFLFQFIKKNLCKAK